MRDKLKQFLLQNLLACVIIWLLAAVAIAAGAFWHYTHEYRLVAIFCDTPFVLLSLLAAAGSYLEWKARESKKLLLDSSASRSQASRRRHK